MMDNNELFSLLYILTYLTIEDNYESVRARGKSLQLDSGETRLRFMMDWIYGRI
jgi:hypothetical protein